MSTKYHCDIDSTVIVLDGGILAQAIGPNVCATMPPPASKILDECS